MTSWARISPPPWCCAKARPATNASCAALSAARVADFKVPRRIVFLTEIPKGATGKLQRIGLHEKLAQKLGMAG